MQTTKKQSHSSMKNDSDNNLKQNSGSSRKGLSSMDNTTTGKSQSRSASIGSLSNTGSSRRSR